MYTWKNVLSQASTNKDLAPFQFIPYDKATYHVLQRSACQICPFQCTCMILLMCHGRETSPQVLLDHSWQVYAPYRQYRPATGRGFAHAQSESRKQSVSYLFFTQGVYEKCVVVLAY